MPLREKQFRQKVFCVNPAHLYTEHLGAPARYNPLQILLDDWMMTERNKDLIADAQSIALQLCPEPAATGENTFFQKRIEKNTSLSSRIFDCVSRRRLKLL
jgi:type IV secretion system protein VirD4